LVLLDIKVKEPTEESLARGKKLEYMEPRYMRTHQAAEQLLEAEANLGQKIYDENTPCFGLARVGTPTQQVVSGTLSDFLKIDLGEPLHSFVICGEMHHIEEEMYKYHLEKK
jgi:diphthine synthase